MTTGSVQKDQIIELTARGKRVYTIFVAVNPLRVHKRTINQNTSRRVQRDNFAQRMAREWVGAGPGDNGPKGGGGVLNGRSMNMNASAVCGAGGGRPPNEEIGINGRRSQVHLS